MLITFKNLERISLPESRRNQNYFVLEDDIFGCVDHIIVGIKVNCFCKHARYSGKNQNRLKQPYVMYLLQ